MERFKSITIENNEKYLRQISKIVDINDPEIHNNIVVLQEYCMQNDVMAMEINMKMNLKVLKQLYYAMK